MIPSATVWDNSSWVWRVASLVGLVTAIAVAWLVSFYQYYDARAENYQEAARSANIVLVWAALLATVFWVEMAWRGRFAWLWIVVWTSPFHAILLSFVTMWASQGGVWWASQGGLWIWYAVAQHSADRWMDVVAWVNLVPQVWVGWRAMRLARRAAEEASSGARHPERDTGQDAATVGRRRPAISGFDAVMWPLAAFVLVCVWFPDPVVLWLVRACGGGY